MEVISKKNFLDSIDYYLMQMKEGKVFIFPTDTVYGIGCIATNVDSILRIREAKKRDNRAMSIIAPSIDWIKKNYIINEYSNVYLDQLPGKYTFILEYNNIVLPKEINERSNDHGVRIPEVWFSDVIAKLDQAFIATSANISGQKPIKNINDIDSHMYDYIDYMIDDGTLGTNPSTIIDLRTPECKIIRE